MRGELAITRRSSHLARRNLREVLPSRTLGFEAIILRGFITAIGSP